MKSTDAVYAEKIAEQYAKKSTPKVVALKKLDRKARQPAEMFAYTFGVIGALGWREAVPSRPRRSRR